jgi:hypothetical protein
MLFNFCTIYVKPILHRFYQEHYMPSSDGNPSSKPAFKISLADVRNGAIIVACAAFAYKTLVPVAPAAPVAPVVTPAAPAETASPVVTASPTLAPAPAPVVEEGGSDQISIVNGKLTLGNDPASQRFRAYLKARVQDLNQKGPVVLATAASTVAKPRIPQVTPQAQPAASQALQAQPAAPITRVNEQDPAAAVTTDDGTSHPAPFVDKAAREHIDAISKYVLDNKLPATVKIGFHLDGTPMTPAETEEQIRGYLSGAKDEWTLIYKAPNEKVRLYVFTDTTCPYCQKLHRSMSQLLSAGISVHYLLYPRDMATMPEGALSSTAVNMMNVWCSVDQKSAMNSAFEGYKINPTDCASLPESLNRWPSPVPSHFKAGEMFNVTGTPAWFASNGKHDIGYSDAKTMIRTLLGE